MKRTPAKMTLKNSYVMTQEQITRPTSNAIRCYRARKALEFYKHRQLTEAGPIGQDDLTDLLADLMHMSDGNPEWDFHKSVDLAQSHFLAEHGNPGPKRKN